MIKHDSLNAVAMFVEAVDAGGFAMAAQRLRLSRSAVGKAIARLEADLSTRLVHRTTRTFTLTDEGKVYYAYCVRALAQLSDARAVLDAGRGAPAGRLRVTVPTLFGRMCVTPILLQLSARHPALSLEIFLTDQTVDLQQDGFDLAVRMGALPDSATLAARSLGVQKMVVCAAPAYLDQHGRPATIEALAGHSAVMYHDGQRVSPWFMRDAQGAIMQANVRSRLHFNDLQTIADAAIAAHGLAWIPSWLARPFVADGTLEIIVDSDTVIASGIHALWPAAPHMPHKTRCAIDLLLAQLPSYLSDA